MPGATRFASGNELFDLLLYLPAVTFPTLAANASGSNTATIPNVQVGDFISWNMQNPPAHLVLDNAYVSAPNTVTLLWSSDSTGISTATVPVLIGVVRPENVVDGGIATLPAGVY